MNEAQKSHLNRHGVTSVSDIADPLERLRYDELSVIPDPEPEPEAHPLTPAAREYLAGRDLSSLSPADREMIEYLQGPGFQSRPAATGGESGGGSSLESGRAKEASPYALDPRKLDALSPTRRSHLADLFTTVRTGRREHADGVYEGARRVKPQELAYAEEAIRPYLAG